MAAKVAAPGCEPVVGSLSPSKKRDYRVTNRLQEGKRPLYAVVFNFIDSRFFNVFATVGGNRATVYQCLEGGVIALLQSYIDEDKDESFYTVSWACSIDGTPFLVAGGINGIIRAIDAGNEKIHKSFSGHGDSINEIRTQALRPSLVVSASKDESVRLWNVHTGICILIFAGAGGHRNEVLSVDFHPSDIYRIASCGMDNTVKIWSMKEFWTYVETSFTWTDLPSKFPTKYVQFPVFIASVHTNYVDCNRWLGDFVMSKSVDNEIVLWEAKMKEQSPGEGSVGILQKYPVPECDIWFIKFSCDFNYNAAAIGQCMPQLNFKVMDLSVENLSGNRQKGIEKGRFLSGNFKPALLFSLQGYPMYNPSHPLGRLPCHLMEAPLSAAVKTVQFGDGTR